jgi:hypothetical protein
VLIVCVQEVYCVDRLVQALRVQTMCRKVGIGRKPNKQKRKISPLVPGPAAEEGQGPPFEPERRESAAAKPPKPSQPPPSRLDWLLLQAIQDAVAACGECEAAGKRLEDISAIMRERNKKVDAWDKNYGEKVRCCDRSSLASMQAAL